MKKFICVRGWKRNPTGEIIEEWEYNKLPDEVKNRNFKEYVPEPKVEEKETFPIPKITNLFKGTVADQIPDTKPYSFKVDDPE